MSTFSNIPFNRSGKLHSNIMPQLIKNTTYQSVVEIKKHLVKLNNIGYLFNDEIGPVDCDHISQNIKATQYLIDNYFKYIKKIPDPRIKYQTIVSLSCVEEELQAVYSLFQELRPICREEDKEKKRLQNRILNHVENISSIYSEM